MPKVVFCEKCNKSFIMSTYQLIEHFNKVKKKKKKEKDKKNPDDI